MQSAKLAFFLCLILAVSARRLSLGGRPSMAQMSPQISQGGQMSSGGFMSQGDQMSQGSQMSQGNQMYQGGRPQMSQDAYQITQPPTPPQQQQDMSQSQAQQQQPELGEQPWEYMMPPN